MTNTSTATSKVTTSLMDHYKAIEDGSRRMLAAALAGDWQQVAQLEGDCGLLIQRLKRHARAAGQEVALQPQERQEKQRILQRILSVDAQVRRLLDPWGDITGASVQARPALLH